MKTRAQERPEMKKVSRRDLDYVEYVGGSGGASAAERAAIAAHRYDNTDAGTEEWGKLMNWPPSRGPRPAWMEREPILSMRPYKIIKVCNSRETPAVKGRTLSLSHSVEVVGTLAANHDVWELIGGAELSTYKLRRRGMGKPMSGPKSVPRARLTQWMPFVDGAVRVTLSYPLSVNVTIEISPYTVTLPISETRSRIRKQMSVGYVLWQIAQAYRELYRDHEKYGVWGHALGDLVFEQMVIGKSRIEIGIGS